MNNLNDNNISDFFYKIGEIFASKRDIDKILENILISLSDFFHSERSMIHIYNTESEEMHADIYHGYQPEEIKRGVYKSGEGIIGRVSATGEPVLIKDISKSTEFLNKTGARDPEKESIAFICIPIKISNKVIGTLSADITKDKTVLSLEDIFEYIKILGIMIANLLNDRKVMLEAERKLIDENRKLKIKLNTIRPNSKLIGESGIMKELYENILMVAETSSTVLITGESGTGKELIADAIHNSSKRKNGPFIKVNIASLPDNLIESELFGYEKGAFTGAYTAKPGRFEMAEGGTIFLDEIGDLSYPMQVKLLRVLQEKNFERVGGTKTISIDIRIIAATHQNLEEKIKKEQFRADLYYRLNVFPIHSPSLRDRRTDILLLTDYFIEKYSMELNKDVKRISTEAINMLTAYHWPGNVRELENCIQRAVIVSREEVIRSYHLPPTLQMASKSESSHAKRNYDEIIRGYEKEIITDHLKMTAGNITQAANILGTTKRILTYKVNNLGIDYKKFR
ncbi:MAG: sigma 54-interacting transcriptional regulator [Spirochaetes bacterium]|nr:sigma 54-interacting transcriptional regulator [Spirochaetota bacterium]